MIAQGTAIGAAAVIALAGTAAIAETSKPSPFGSQETNLRWALNEMCFPHVLDGRSEAELVDRPFVSKQPAPGPMWRAMNVAAYQISFKGPVVFGFGGEPKPSCTVSVGKGEAEPLAAALRDVLASRPENFRLAASAPPANTFARREVYCGASADGRRWTVLASVGRNRDGLIVTVSPQGEPSRYCDAGA